MIFAKARAHRAAGHFDVLENARLFENCIGHLDREPLGSKDRFCGNCGLLVAVVVVFEGIDARLDV